MRRIPDYYEKFQCAGGTCKDNCCIGWDVYVDEESACRYKNETGDFGQQLKNYLSMEEEPHFQMKEDGRCPFLNKDNLCEIYIRLGEDELCEICTMHPRFADTYNGITEIGLGLSCEVAAELILNWKDKVRFLDLFEEEPEKNILFLYRDKSIQILQNREKTMFERWYFVLAMGEDLQQRMNQGKEIHDYEFPREKETELKTINLNSWFCEVTNIFKEFDYMTEEFQEILNGAGEFQKKEIDEILWEQLSVYFIYRYFMKSVFDDNPLEKIKISLISFLMIYQWSQRVEVDMTEVARLYSKEVEYSMDNLDVLREEILFDGCFETDVLKNVLVASGNL